jgi:hypothetical protein
MTRSNLQSATPTDTSRATRSRWRTIAAESVMLGAAVFCIVSVATPALASDPSDDFAVVECRSGLVTDGDVQMSSLLAAKVPVTQLPEIPGECSVR